MNKRLHISAHFSLPLELVTSTQAILARKRSGKSYTASVQAEELLDAGQQIGVFDPTGAWWGLRSSADGKRTGYQVAIFGGKHGDAPLDPRSGKAMAVSFMEQEFSAIFDVKSFSTKEQLQFVMDFSAELLRLNTRALHIFIDEADTFAPQTPRSREASQCLDLVTKLVKQGGLGGTGVTMITQRPASLNWDVLSQIDLLTILRMSAPLDIKPVVAWLETETNTEFAKQVKAALPSLPVGTAFVASAAWGIAERVQVRERTTFNSGATPKPGERKQEPKVLAAIDVARLGKEIADSVQRAKDASPETLRARIAELEKQVAAKDARAPQETISGMTEEERKVVEMLKEKLEALSAEIEAMETRESQRDQQVATARQLCVELAKALGAESLNATPSSAAKAMVKESRALLPALPLPATKVPRPAAAVTPKEIMSRPDTTQLSGVDQRILGALAQFRAIGVERPAKMHVCLFSGYSNMASKGFANAVSSLRTAGLIDYPGEGTIMLTPAGIAAAPASEPIHGDGDLQARIETMLSGPETKIFRIAVGAYPKAVAKETVMEQSGYGNAASKGFANSVSRLRSLGFIDYPSRGEIVATAQCFLPR